MKFFFFIFIIATVLAAAALAQNESGTAESAKYNFGSMQPSKEIRAAPGDEIATKLYFYNIYGNRITHIVLSIAQAPEGWNVSIEPDVHDAQVVISGVPTTVKENLYVEPSSAVNEAPATIPEGIEYIQSGVGNIGAKFVTIRVSVPKSEKLGTVGRIVVDAAANWLGQGGTVAISQSRSFDYTVTVASEEFSETIVKPQAEAEKAVSEGGKEVKEEATEGLEQPVQPEVEAVQQEAAKAKGGLIPLLVIVIILMAAFIVVLIRKKR